MEDEFARIFNFSKNLAWNIKARSVDGLNYLYE